MVKEYTPQITRLKSGKYQYSVRYIDPLTGKVKRPSVTLDKATAAAKRKAQQLIEEKISQSIAGGSSQSLTLQGLAEKYLAWLKRNTTYQSYYVYKSALKLCLKDIDQTIIADNLPRPFVANYFNALLQDKSYSTVNVRKSAFAAMYNFGVTYGYIKHNPVDKLVLNRPKQTRAKDITNKYFTDKEYRAFIDCLERQGRDDYADFFQFLYYTGLRAGEGACLSFDDFAKKDDGWFVRINGTLVKSSHNGKTGDYYKQKGAKTAAGNRIIYVPDKAMELVLKRKNNRPFVFLNQATGGPMINANINAIMKATARRIKLHKNVSSHFFRHTHVSKLAEKGVPLDVIVQRVGHSGTQTILKIYEHITSKAEHHLENALKSF